jgi:hypothetical protein
MRPNPINNSDNKCTFDNFVHNECMNKLEELEKFYGSPDDLSVELPPIMAKPAGRSMKARIGSVERVMF